MHLSDLPDIGIEPNSIDPSEHNPQIRHHPHDAIPHERKRRRDTPPDNLLKHRTHLPERQLVARKVDGDIPIAPIMRMNERLRREIPDIRRADQLDLVAGAQRRLQHGDEGPAHEVRGEVLHEADGPQDGVAHRGAVVPPRLEVFLDVELADEVRDRGGVGVGVGAVALDGGVDEVAHVVGERGVDERFALRLFRGGSGAAAEGHLDAEDAPDGGAG